jgi:hypothetical protein
MTSRLFDTTQMTSRLFGRLFGKFFLVRYHIYVDSATLYITSGLVVSPRFVEQEIAGSTPVDFFKILFFDSIWVFGSNPISSCDFGSVSP